MFKLRFLFPIVALIAISDAFPHTDEQLTQELEQAKQEQIKLARRIAKLERQAVALDAEQTSRETSGRNIEIIVGVIAVIKGKTNSQTKGNDDESQAEVGIYTLRRRGYGSRYHYRAVYHTEHRGTAQ